MFLYIVLDAYASFKQKVNRKHRAPNFRYAKF